MSNGLLSDPKKALGFAGVVIALGVGATFAASAFIPAGEAESEVVVSDAEDVPREAPPAAAAQTAWSDEGLADDWGAGAAEPSTNNVADSNSGSNSELGQPDFADYAPDDGAGSSSAPSPRQDSSEIEDPSSRNQARAELRNDIVFD